MLFNSYSFIFFFVPLTVAGYFAFGRLSRDWALGWLILASLFFYAWWNPINVLIMTPSVLINYGLARDLERLADEDNPHPASKYVLAAGLVFNILFLGYFKYINFFRSSLNDVLGTDFVLTAVVLPLGISFITFQKIALLFGLTEEQGPICLPVGFVDKTPSPRPHSLLRSMACDWLDPGGGVLDLPR